MYAHIISVLVRAYVYTTSWYKPSGVGNAIPQPLSSSCDRIY